jgi:hypothetical protein
MAPAWRTSGGRCAAAGANSTGNTASCSGTKLFRGAVYYRYFVQSLAWYST